MLLAYYAKKEGNIYMVKDFEEGHCSFSKYLEFYNHYVCEVVGQCKFNDRILNYSGNGILATQSDKALDFVLLDNIEDRNLDICKKTGGKVEAVTHGSNAPPGYKRTVPPKWTK